MADQRGSAFQQQMDDMQIARDRAGEASEPMTEATKGEQPQRSAVATGSVSPRSQLAGASRDDPRSFRHEPSSFAAVTKQAGGSMPIEDQSAVPGSSEEHKGTDDPASKQVGCQKQGHVPSHSMAETP